jgi:hypothetical protein
VIRTDKRTFVGPSPSRGLRCLPDDRLRPQLRFNATPKRRLLSDMTNTGELGDRAATAEATTWILLDQGNVPGGDVSRSRIRCLVTCAGCQDVAASEQANHPNGNSRADARIWHIASVALVHRYTTFKEILLLAHPLLHRHAKSETVLRAKYY